MISFHIPWSVSWSWTRVWSTFLGIWIFIFPYWSGQKSCASKASTELLAFCSISDVTLRMLWHSPACTYYALILAKLVAWQLCTPLITIPLIILLLPQLRCVIIASCHQTASIPSIKLPRLPALAQKYLLVPPFPCCSVLHVAAHWRPFSVVLLCFFLPISSPPAFWPFQTNAGYLHPAVCTSTTQVCTSPCWFPQCVHLEHPNQENTSLPTQQRVTSFPCTSQ